MKYEGALLAVRDMAASRRFYEEFLGQQVVSDYGANLSFAGGISLQEGFGPMIGLPPVDLPTRGHDHELYFETEDLDAFLARLEAQPETVYVHRLKEHPWGQRGLRLRDPDGHIIEVAETMEQLVRRFLSQGMTEEEIVQKTMLSPDFVRSCR